MKHYTCDVTYLFIHIHTHNAQSADYNNKVNIQLYTNSITIFKHVHHSREEYQRKDLLAFLLPLQAKPKRIAELRMFSTN